MKGKKKKFIVMLTIALSCFVLSISLAGCGNKKEELPTEIVNGDFETGIDNLTGWTKSGTAFSSLGVVNTANDTKVGNNYFDGYEAGNQQFTGILTSDKFIFEGEAITFKIGVGKNTEKIFVEIFEDGKDTAISKIGNTAYEEPYITTQLIREVIDIDSSYKGKTLYIKITDNDNSDDMAYVMLDDFKILKTTEEINSYKSERTTQLNLLNPPFVEDETSTTIVNGGFESGTLEGWKLLTGTAFSLKCIENSSSTFWTPARDYFAIGDKFFNGYNNGEAGIGSMRSTKFTLAGDGFISFMLGGAGLNSCYVAICDASDDSELIVISNDSFKDPEMSLNMHREYVNASEYKNKVLYIKVVDGAAAGPFGAITVDDFKVSMTNSDVKALMKSTYESIMQIESNSVNDYIKDFYRNYEYPFELEVLMIQNKIEGKAIKASSSVDLTAFLSEAVVKYGELVVTDKQIDKVVFNETETTSGFDTFDMSQTGLYTVYYSTSYNGMNESASFIIEVTILNQVANGGFETGDLAGWTILTNDTLNRKTSVNSSATFWGEKIPFNQSGNYHFDGWGAQYAEPDAYSLKSGIFTLSGSGFISFKMGGNAAQLKVFISDGTQIAEFNNTEFADVSFPNIDEGCRLATMTTFVADLSDFIGEELYIEIHDKGAAAWGLAFFDNIITYYENAPDTLNGFDVVNFYKKVDDVLQETPTEFNLLWKLAENQYFKITKFASNIAKKTTDEGLDTLDLTTLLSNVEAVYTGLTYPNGFTTVILKMIKPDGTEITDGFTSVDLTEIGIYEIFYSVTVDNIGKTASSSFYIEVTNDNQIVNGGFELSDLTGWTIVSGNVNAINSVSSDKTFWSEGIPFNQSGNYHFDGWQAGVESDTYIMKSTSFVLAGSGMISFKLGGNAASLKVYKADGTIVGEYINTEFADVSFPNVSEGCRLATMTTFVGDLSDYIGQELYIELIDNSSSNWGMGFFDDIITYYETAPVIANNYDVVSQGEISDIQIIWKEALNQIEE